MILFSCLLGFAHWPTLNLVVGGLAQGLTRGLREGCVSYLLYVCKAKSTPSTDFGVLCRALGV